MVDAVLKNRSVAVRITVKSIICAAMIVLSVALPQVAHIIGNAVGGAAEGAAAGSVWMPMYAPALLAGCLLGWQWGAIVGAIAPVASFGFTSLALGAAMPTLARLPYMTIELVAFGVVAGLFAKLIRKNALFAFPAVISAQVAGRVLYVVYNLIAGQNIAYLWESIKTSLPGLYVQAALVPIIVIVLAAVLKKDKNETI